jgi:hypothetical protein
MKIKNKYIRNRHFRRKHWNTVRRKSHPYETYFPYMMGREMTNYSYEKQVEQHFEWIEVEFRMLENGHRGGQFHSTSGYRRLLNAKRKFAERQSLKKINNGNYEAEVPVFKKDADWLFF